MSLRKLVILLNVVYEFSSFSQKVIMINRILPLIREKAEKLDRFLVDDKYLDDNFRVAQAIGELGLIDKYWNLSEHFRSAVTYGAVLAGQDLFLYKLLRAGMPLNLKAFSTGFAQTRFKKKFAPIFVYFCRFIDPGDIFNGKYLLTKTQPKLNVYMQKEDIIFSLTFFHSIEVLSVIEQSIERSDLGFEAACIINDFEKAKLFSAKIEDYAFCFIMALSYNRRRFAILILRQTIEYLKGKTQEQSPVTRQLFANREFGLIKIFKAKGVLNRPMEVYCSGFFKLEIKIEKEVEKIYYDLGDKDSDISEMVEKIKSGEINPLKLGKRLGSLMGVVFDCKVIKKYYG